MDTSLTVVTGIWDLRRHLAPPPYARSYAHYRDHLSRLLKSPAPMVVFADPADEEWILRERGERPIYFRAQRAEDFAKSFDFYAEVQAIRGNPEWRAQRPWLADSPQATLADYNPMVMSKMFMLHDASVWNPFHSDSFVWVDGAITSTVHEGYFTKHGCLTALNELLSTFLFVCFPYEADTEVHGFPVDEMNAIAGAKVDRVARGGVFGGSRSRIGQANALYYQLLRETLQRGVMGTEESIFTLMTYLDPAAYPFETIEADGLLFRFFDRLKDRSRAPVDRRPVLYVLSFNEPRQFELLCKSLRENQPALLERTRKVLINNSTNESVFATYAEICAAYGFEEISKGNLGICGGRQFAAEHFSQTGSPFMFFFEDDMLAHGPTESLCRNGLGRFSADLFDACLEIMKREELDFLKLSFTEFYGDNGEQWAWYNVPPGIRRTLFPEKPERLTNAIGVGPRTRFTEIKAARGISYALGEVYYSNWPQIVSRSVNAKLFLETTWERPHEQTWMSNFFQRTLKGEVKGGVLLLSPIEHHRAFHYRSEERKES